MVLFLLYSFNTADISPLLAHFGLLHHLFADDFQAHIHANLQKPS